jgi:cellulose synthase/poly-beta-1,6-N-acetylglucosamine synthase-like glycosyltransferase
MHAFIDSILIALLGVLALCCVLSCGYLLIATLLSARLPTPRPSARRLRFDVIVPAYNESTVVARTVGSLRRVDWPADLYRVLVVADNCSDDTAEVARGAGAVVLERRDAEHRGKGYALEFAFRHSAARQWADAVVVVDADSECSANLLEACAARLEAGAAAVQVHYGVLNPDASWRTRLITIAKGAFHIVRSRARERLALSCGIRGNGWCVTHELLRAVPFRAFSVTEDIEFGIDLGLAGWRVHYADEAHVDGEMVSNAAVAGKQRQRWESGRFKLIRSRTLPLLRAAWTRRSAVCFDLALDLVILPLSDVALAILALGLLVGLASWWNPVHRSWTPAPVVCAAALVLYVMRGWQLSGTGLAGLLDLVRAPGFMVWKLVLTLRRRTAAGWVRTERER